MSDSVASSCVSGVSQLPWFWHVFGVDLSHKEVNGQEFLSMVPMSEQFSTRTPLLASVLPSRQYRLFLFTALSFSLDLLLVLDFSQLCRNCCGLPHFAWFGDRLTGELEVELLCDLVGEVLGVVILLCRLSESNVVSSDFYHFSLGKQD